MSENKKFGNGWTSLYQVSHQFVIIEREVAHIVHERHHYRRGEEGKAGTADLTL